MSKSVANTLQGNAFYVNLTTITAGTDTYNSNGVGTSVTGVVTTATVGGLLVRDLGKTVRIPATNPTGSTQRLLRKVQRVDTAARTTGPFPVTNGFVGFNEGVGGAADSGSGALPSGFQTFYIDVSEGKWARLSL